MEEMGSNQTKMIPVQLHNCLLDLWSVNKSWVIEHKPVLCEFDCILTQLVQMQAGLHGEPLRTHRRRRERRKQRYRPEAPEGTEGRR